MPIDHRPLGAAVPRTAAARWASRPPAAALLCAVGLALIGLLDLAQEARHWPLPVTAVLDEPAHVLTAGLLLAAVLPGRARAVVPWALAGAVLIDLDHIPFYLWGALSAEGAGRPVTHSVTSVLAAACAGLVTRRRVRTALLGLALGVGLHLVRDLGTGPGVPLWWPVSAHPLLLPYAAYFLAMAAVAVVAAGRWIRPRGTARDRLPRGPR